MESLVAAGLAGGRIAIGAGIWIAPETTLGALGFGGKPDARALALARLAGTRDLLLGAWMASSMGSRERLQPAAAAVTACDAGDALTFALLGSSDRRASILGALGAGSATLAGAWLTRRLSVQPG